MMKRFISALLVALLLLCPVFRVAGAEESEDVIRTVGAYTVVANHDQRTEADYPCALKTENSLWLLARDDIALMGEEAFYEGLADILQYMEADLADARQALAGRIWAEVPPVEIRTDFCGKAGISQDAGAYYNGRVNMIKIFHSWDMAKFALLHEYVHYLTVHCAEKKTMSYFFAETVAEYVSKILCENRMLRSVDLNKTEQPQLRSLAEVWGDFDEVKYRTSCLSESDAYAQGAYDGMAYLCVGQFTTYRWANKRLPDHLYELSYAEAVSVALYLMETGGADEYLDNWDVTEEEKLAGLYGYTVPELLAAWAAWNAEQCVALGLRPKQPEPMEKASEAEDVVRTVGVYAVVRNHDVKADTYPCLVRTESAVWYLAAADLELLGEEAFYAGLADVLQYFDLDAADARGALAGRIPAEIPPVEIRTDFANQDEVAQRYSAYYNQPFDLIQLFHGWKWAKISLLHEYVHYLTFHCAEKKTPGGFYGEAVAEYVSRIVCENRMCLSDKYGYWDDPEGMAILRAWGVWDEKRDNLDYAKYVLCISDAFARGLYDGESYGSVGQNALTRTADKRLPSRVNDLSYSEAMSLALYLIETYGEAAFLDNWDLPADKVAATFLDRQGLSARKAASLDRLSDKELLSAWSAWNAQKCAELGIRMDRP